MNNDMLKFSIDIINDMPDEEENLDFALAKVEGLSCGYNTHGLILSEEVLKRDAKTCLGKFIVAKMNQEYLDITNQRDFEGHESNEVIIGYIPQDAKIEFVENDSNNGVFFRVDAVISKLYTNGAMDIFRRDIKKSVSCEFTCTFDEENENVITSFNIRGITVLGSSINPSCTGANIEIIQFSEDKANKFYQDKTNTVLQKFVESRKSMTEKKTYKIDKSKEAMSDKPWGNVDKIRLRNKVIEAKNASTLVKSVYLLVEDGWRDSPSEHLKYPVMELKGDTFVYNRDALASAKAYATQHDEQEVLDKLSKIYKKLKLDEEGDEKMSEVKFSAVDIENLWCRIRTAIDEREHWDFCIDGIYEEDNQKFAVLCDREGTCYRVDFSLTTDGLELAEEAVKVEREFLETETVIKFEETEDLEKYKSFVEKTESEEVEEKVENENKEPEEQKESKTEGQEEMADDSYVEPMAQVITEQIETEKDEDLIRQLEEKEDIIMKQNQELEELRKFKEETLEIEKTTIVNNLLAKLQGKIKNEEYEKLEADSKEIKFAEVTAWKNGVLASYAENILESVEGNEDIIRMSIPQDKREKLGLWDRLK